jgi:hypothetical protein
VSALIRFGGEAFGRPAMWLGDDIQITWMGWRWWRPFVRFCPIAADEVMAAVWRWQFFIGPLEIRGWVPRSPSPATEAKGATT